MGEREGRIRCRCRGNRAAVPVAANREDGWSSVYVGRLRVSENLLRGHTIVLLANTADK